MRTRLRLIEEGGEIWNGRKASRHAQDSLKQDSSPCCVHPGPGGTGNANAPATARQMRHVKRRCDALARRARGFKPSSDDAGSSEKSPPLQLLLLLHSLPVQSQYGKHRGRYLVEGHHSSHTTAEGANSRELERARLHVCEGALSLRSSDVGRTGASVGLAVGGVRGRQGEGERREMGGWRERGGRRETEDRSAGTASSPLQGPRVVSGSRSQPWSPSASGQEARFLLQWGLCDAARADAEHKHDEEARRSFGRCRMLLLGASWHLA
ncbi:hypothetical protein TREES_T100017913 [Tupaia chinensis]|uniref:Uncharacterized protein n=1 Tax=Tupaia chinensis TaxID=246437 RepID=L9JR10_TUPCH|nr:hypothetical protein TREES_T100017913 [Tupaia chinensis]